MKPIKLKDLLTENKSSGSYADEEELNKWDKLIKQMPTPLKNAISDIEAGTKDKYSERLVAMGGKNYIYKNVKGKQTTPWNKDVKSLLGGNLFAFHIYTL